MSLARQRGLTPRSSGAPTAGHAGQQALGLRPILRLLPSAPCRRRPLSSNVRRRKDPEITSAGSITARPETCGKLRSSNSPSRAKHHVNHS